MRFLHQARVPGVDTSAVTVSKAKAQNHKLLSNTADEMKTPSAYLFTDLKMMFVSEMQIGVLIAREVLRGSKLLKQKSPSSQ